MWVSSKPRTSKGHICSLGVGTRYLREKDAEDFGSFPAAGLDPEGHGVPRSRCSTYGMSGDLVGSSLG